MSWTYVIKLDLPETNQEEKDTLLRKTTNFFNLANENKEELNEQFAASSADWESPLELRKIENIRFALQLTFSFLLEEFEKVEQLRRDGRIKAIISSVLQKNDLIEKISYGLIPWMKVGREWYMLLQFSGSRNKKNQPLKLDPFRGQQKEDETPWKTAVRKTFEESCNLIQLNNFEPPQNIAPSNNLFHIQVSFSSADAVATFMHEFESNHRNPASQNPDIKGIAWANADVRTGRIKATQRLKNSFQINKLQDEMQERTVHENIPIVILHPLPQENGEYRWGPSNGEVNESELIELDLTNFFGWRSSSIK